VEVSNFPACPGIVHFVGFTTTSIDASYVLTLNRACHDEFPGTRACGFFELRNSIPPPPTWSGEVFVGHPTIYDAAECISSPGGLVGCTGPPYPVACCGF
jgi:hypothetical protein